MNAEGTVTVKEEGMTENQIRMQLKVLKANLLELQSNIQKLGLYWLVRLISSLVLLLGLFYTFFLI